MFRKYAADPGTEEGKKAKEIGLESLRKMALGGIYDQIGKVSDCLKVNPITYSILLLKVACILAISLLWQS